MTVAHCVHEPWRDIWWQGLDFHPGRNLAVKDVGSSPLGSAPKADVRLHPNWTSVTAASASDAAIIITSTPIGHKVGWFRHKPPAYITQQQQQQQQQQGQSAMQAKLQSAEGLNALVSQQQLALHIAGYPDDKQNGSMWQQCCSVLDWQLQGNLLWHDCYARGGNSGSPVWVVWQSHSSSGKPALSWDQFHAVGVHSSSLKFPSDSQVGVYAEELYAQSVARAQQRQAAAAAGQTVPSCTAATGSLTVAPVVVSAAAAPVALPSKARTSEAGAAVAGQTQATATAAVSGVGRKVGQTAAATPVGPIMSSTGAATAQGSLGPATGHKRRRALLAGAGGRQEDGLTLLPVAVPFTSDTYAWIEQVLKEFEQCPGE